RAWIANRHDVVGPVLGKFLHSADHVLRGHFRPRGKLAYLLLVRGLDLDVCPADVDHKDFHQLFSQTVNLRPGIVSCPEARAGVCEFPPAIHPASASVHDRRITKILLTGYVESRLASKSNFMLILSIVPKQWNSRLQGLRRSCCL